MLPKRGFILGKFMPLHNGHIYLCNVANAITDKLTVLLCSRDQEPIDGYLRYDWMRKSLTQDIDIIHLHRDIPQEPSDHPDFWQIWKNVIKSLHPEPIDQVFGSEPYILRLASELGAEPILIDLDRNVVPVSATMIRENPATHWQQIPSAVRPFYQKRVCLLGPESVGKTTLCSALAKEFNTLSIPEYGRSYDELYKQGKDWCANDFVAITQRHIAFANEISERAGPICFEDTDILQTLVWAEFLMSSAPTQLTNTLRTWKPAQFYLLLKPDVSWVDDGTRYSGQGKVRYWFYKCLLTRLEELGLGYRVIDGSDWQHRTQLAKETVADLV